VHCASPDTRLEAYLDGSLSGAARAEVRAHLATCGSCAGLLGELRALDGLLTARRDVVLPDDFAATLMDAAGTLPAPRRARRPIAAYVVSYLLGSWLLIAAAFLLGGAAIRSAGAAVARAGAALAPLGGALLRGGGRAIVAAVLVDAVILAGLLAVLVRLRRAQA